MAITIRRNLRQGDGGTKAQLAATNAARANQLIGNARAGGFDAEQYVSGLSDAELNNMVGMGANLPTYEQRAAATAAAQRLLSQRNPSPSGVGRGMGANDRQVGASGGSIGFQDGSRAIDPGFRGTNQISLPAGVNALPGGGGVQDPTAPTRQDGTPHIPLANNPTPGVMSGMGPSGRQTGVTPGGQVSSTVQPGQGVFNHEQSTPQPPAVGTPQPPSTGAPISGVPSDGAFGGPSAGLAGSEQAYKAALAGGLGMLEQGTAQARGDLMQAGAGANQTLNRYYQPGQEANSYQAALSGALGGDAQPQAFERFQNSPGQQYLLDRSERAIRRNAAATGGLGGGNVQQALQRNAIGLAAQDFDNAFNRLGQVSDRGLTAGGQISGNTMATGQQLANLTSGNARAGAGLIASAGDRLGAGRTRAGEMIAGNIEGTSGNLASMMYGTGRDMSNVTGQGASNLAELLAGAGQADQQSQAQFAELLANLASNQGAQFAGLPTLGSTQQTDGSLDDVLTILSGL